MELNVKINAAIESFLSAMKQANAEVQKLTNGAGKPVTVTADTSQAEKALNGLNNEIKETGASLSKLGGGGALDGLKNSFKEGQAQASAGGGIFGSIASSVGQLASPIGAATAGLAALGAGLTYAMDVGQKFEQGMAGLGAITGLSGSALDAIGTRAQDLAVKFGGSVTSQVDSFQGVLSRFGADLAKTPEDLGKVSESINVLAKAGGIDAATAMDTLTGSMLQFGVNTADSKELASESARFINVMAASARVGAAEIPQVGEAITVAGVAMKGAKVSFEEGNAAIQVLAAGGKYGAEAGTALRNVLGKMAGAEVIPKEALAKLTSLGVNMKIVSDTTLPFEVRLKEMGKAAGDATAFAQVFGSENAAAASILANGAAQVGAWTKEITGTNDANTQAAVNMNTLSERFNRGKAAVESFAIDAYKVLAPIISGVIGVISDVFDKVKSAVMPVLTQLGQNVGAVFQRIQSVVVPILATIGGFIVTYLVTYWTAVSTAVSAVLSTVVKIFDGIVAAFEPIVTIFKKAFGMDGEAGKSIDVMQVFGNVLTAITGVISFLGEVATELGGLFAEFVITPLKVGITVISAIIEPIVAFAKHLFGIGETSVSVGGFFQTFIDIVKQAPAFIHAITAGFRAFTSGVTDLITNFSFDKLKNLLTGKTVADAFTGSMNESKLKDLQDKALAAFDGTFKLLAEKRKAFENEKSELSSPGSAVQTEKDKQKKIYDDEIARITKSIDAKKAAGEITKEQESALRAKLLEIIKIAAEKEDEESAKAADAKKEDDKKALKSLADEIKKAKQENAKLLGDADVKAIADEKERDLKAAEEKTKNAVQSVKNESDKVKAMKDVVKSEQLALLTELTEKEKIIIAQGETEKAAIRGKYALKEFDEMKKRYDDAGKREIELAKDNAEALSKIEAVGGSTGGNRIKDLEALNDAKRKLAAAQMEAEVDAAIDANAKVLEAYDALRKAVERGDKEAQKKLESAYNNEVFLAEQTDAMVILAKQKGAIALEKLDTETREKIATIRIAAITDDAERESAERQAAIKKALDAELLAAVGNERLIADAHRKANIAKYDSDQEYARKTTDLNVRLGQELQDLGMSLIGNLAAQRGSTFDDLNSAFDKYSADVSKKLDGTNKESEEKANEETKALRSQLSKREISYKDYQEKTTAIAQKSSEEQATAADRANLEIGKSFQSMAKNADAGLKKVFAKMEEDAKGGKNIWKTFADNSNDIFTGLATNVAGTLGAMAAAGTLTLESAGKAAIGIALDTAGNVALSQSPAIMAISIGQLGPILGAIAGIGAIASIQTLIAITKGAIGADKGAIGIDSNYSTPRSSRDTIPIWIRSGESVITPEGTANNRGVLDFINRTNRPASEFYSNSVVTAGGVLQMANSNNIRTAQLFTGGGNVAGGGSGLGRVEGSLANIENSLANAKIIETRSKHVSAVDVRVTADRGLIARQEKAALRLQRARK